jgi:hypothetical protein
MWERLSDNRKRQIKKGTNGANDANGANGENDVREWYGILEKLYRTKVKTPLWPVEFFLEAYRQGVAKFLLVKHESKIIGGSMVVTNERVKELRNEGVKELRSEGVKELRSEGVNGGAVYEWFECGLNGDYKEQYPSVMATWGGMRWAHEHGCARYDMMGAGEPGVPYGVRDFKSEFGGTMVEHGRFLCVCKPWLYKIGEMGVKMMKG